MFYLVSRFDRDFTSCCYITSELFNIAQFSVLLSSKICNFCEKDINLKERQSIICIPMNEFSHCFNSEESFNRFLAAFFINDFFLF